MTIYVIIDDKSHLCIFVTTRYVVKYPNALLKHISLKCKYSKNIFASYKKLICRKIEILNCVFSVLQLSFDNDGFSPLDNLFTILCNIQQTLNQPYNSADWPKCVTSWYIFVSNQITNFKVLSLRYILSFYIV